MNRRIHIDMQVRVPRERAANHAAESPSRSEADNRIEMRPRASTLESKLKTYGSRELFNGYHEVAIEHGGSLYRLRITRQGKLILNK